MISGRLRPLTKNATNGTYVKYYPSVAFLPSVALGTLLTTNLVRLVAEHVTNGSATLDGLFLPSISSIAFTPFILSVPQKYIPLG